MKVNYGNLPFKEAIKFFQEKGLKTSPNSWRDVWQQANRRAFTVARVTAMDVLSDIRDAVDKAVGSGQSLGDFKKELKEILEKKGWFAPKGEKAKVEMPDGTVKKRLTGWRLDTIYRANLQTAYSVGRYKQMSESKTRQYWQYMAIMDAATRASHGAQHGKVYHRLHPFWNRWFPPNGFGCRCYVKSLSARQMEQRGLSEEIKGAKEKPDEGWRYNPGKEGLDSFRPELNKYPKQLSEQFEKEMDAVFD